MNMYMQDIQDACLNDLRICQRYSLRLKGESLEYGTLPGQKVCSPCRCEEKVQRGVRLVQQLDCHAVLGQGLSRCAIQTMAAALQLESFSLTHLEGSPSTSMIERLLLDGNVR